MARTYTELEEYQGIYSDIFKDVHGFRPRHTSDEHWNDLEWLKREVADLAIELEAQVEWEAKVQAENVVKFEAKIQELIQIGAGDRETAIRWLVDGECGGREDIGYFEFLWNIPYGYVEKAA